MCMFYNNINVPYIKRERGDEEEENQTAELAFDRNGAYSDS